MNLQPILRSVLLDGDLKLGCPYGSIDFSASRAENRLDVRFTNDETFRYFLNSLPNSGPLKIRKQLQQLKQIPQEMQVAIGDTTILEKKQDGSLDINLRYGAKQWLRTRLGL